jgi:hypothetical protein
MCWFTGELEISSTRELFELTVVSARELLEVVEFSARELFKLSVADVLLPAASKLLTVSSAVVITWVISVGFAIGVDCNLGDLRNPLDSGLETTGVFSMVNATAFGANSGVLASLGGELRVLTGDLLEVNWFTL